MAILWFGIPYEASARSREADSDQKFEMADRRDWGGGGDDPEESTQRMIERIWESLTYIQRRMDQQAPVPQVAVPPGDGETVHVAPVPPGVKSVGASKGKAPAGPSSSGFGKWGQKLKQAFKGKGRGWGGRQQFQQGRGRPEVEESQQSTARQPIIPPEYRCYNCNQPGNLIRNCPYPREYGYGRGVQQQQQPQQFQQPQARIWTSSLGGLIGDSHVDANLCDLQNIGLPESSSLTPFSLSLALSSCLLLPHYFQELCKDNWRNVECETVTNRPRKHRDVVQLS
ncbi:hypothetical protein Taro_005816 [Colocasia esculenta]|uniref:CCHC-type domain-containing protein n=1 Tax=Colocasia esculenta TaxID=4460 RepID=A0A843TQV4_COLES|nr:hypothetical protein [Colocasia esculenta]